MYDDVIRKLPFNNEVYEKSLEQGYSKLQSSIIATKLTDANEIDSFFNARLSDIPDISIIGDIDTGSDLLKHHIDRNSRIAVVVDYDADGISSAAIIYRFLKNVFKYNMANVVFIINKRENGNGISEKLLHTIIEEHNKQTINLVITADHGSANGVSIGKLNDLKIDTLVTDHHIVPEINSAHNATVFVNPQKDDVDTFKYISGCAVAYMLMLNTKNRFKYVDDMHEVLGTLPIVAISTIGDAMALDNKINRAIVLAGLKELNSLKDPLWQAIKYLLDVNVLLDEETIGFNVVPAINAASRMGEPDAAFRFYISDDYRDSVITFERLLEINTSRKKLQKHLIRNAMLQCINTENENAVVITLTQGLGLNGIVSSNVGERFNKPIVTFVKKDGSYHGSGRAINKHFNLHKALTDIHAKDPSIIVKFGGHKGAAGCEVHADKINEFKRAFDNEAVIQLANKTVMKLHEVVGTIEVDSLNDSIVNEIKTLAPFGMRLNKPLFVGIFELYKVFYIGRDSEHVNLKFLLKNGTIVDSFIFNSTEKFDHDLLVTGNKLKIVYRPVFNTFRGGIEFRLDVEYLTKFE